MLLILLVHQNITKPPCQNTIKTDTRSRQTDAEAAGKQFLTKWLQGLPKLELHYCRSTTSKLYLEPVFFSKIDDYQQYKLSYLAASWKGFSIDTLFEKTVFKKICIYKGKKVQCDLWIAYNLRHQIEEKYNEYQEKERGI